MSGIAIELPVYEAASKVWALQIEKVAPLEGGGVRLFFYDKKYKPIDKDKQWAEQNIPWVNGYWVRHQNGREVWLSGPQFERMYGG